MKSADLKLSLRNIVTTRRLLESLMSTLEIKDIDSLFDNNPVFWDGVKPDPSDIQEQVDTDKFIHLIDMLSKTHTHLIRAQETMLRLGIHHVRLEAGTRLSQKVEERD